MKRSILVSLASLALLAGTMTSVGCARDRDRVSLAELRRNPSPELDHTSRSKEQARNDRTRMLDNQGRGLWDDLDRLLLTDRNRMLTPYSEPPY